MYKGQVMIYVGIALIAASVLLVVLFAILFAGWKKKLLEEIYGK